jgi:hypothetical protein
MRSSRSSLLESDGMEGAKTEEVEIRKIQFIGTPTIYLPNKSYLHPLRLASHFAYRTILLQIERTPKYSNI